MLIRAQDHAFKPLHAAHFLSTDCIRHKTVARYRSCSSQRPPVLKFDCKLSCRAVNPILGQQGSPLMAPRTADAGMDPYGLLLRERIVILGGEVTDFSADAVISQLLLLDSTDPKKDIKLFINSPGGSVSAGMGIYDTMQLCRADISTYCFGLAASMGAFLLGAGTQGKRYSMPNARIMIHQPLGGASGQAIDVEIQVRPISFCQHTYVENNLIQETS